MLNCLLTSLGLLPNSDDKTTNFKYKLSNLCVTNGKSAFEVTFQHE
jgi:hypothetical protein